MTIPLTIKKRTGDIVPFDEKKILEAMRKAFVAQGVSIEEKDLQGMADDVVLRLAERIENSDYVPTVEQVQDLVERAIMEKGYFDVAKHYIIYRFEHTKERARKVIEKIEEGGLMVTKTDGRKEKFSLEKLRKAIAHRIYGLENDIDIEKIVNQTSSEIYDGIKTKDVARSLIMVCRSMMERDMAYSYLAARLLITEFKKEAIGPGIDYAKIDEQYRQVFETNVRKAVELKKLDERMLSYDFAKLSLALKPERDNLFQYVGVETLSDRYLIRDPETKNALETPQFFWMRVAMGLALNEKGKEEKDG